MKMWKTAAAAAAGLALFAGVVHADVFDLESTLNGDNEVPPNQSEATGAAVMSYDDNTNLFFLDILVTGINLADVIGTHIHQGASGVNGPVIVNLLANASWQQDGDDIRLTIVDGMFPEANELDLLTGGTYINVHTNAFPAGEIRGQLVLGGGGGDCDDGPAFAGTINEIRIDQPGSDNDEYFELVGEPGATLDGVFYIVIGDGDGGNGTVEAIVDLTGHCIPDDGRFLVAESTFTLNGVVPDLVLSNSELNFENSDNVTHMLVRNLNPAINVGSGFGGSDLDANDDGIIDDTGDYDGDMNDDGPPFDSIIDDVALVEEIGGGDFVYSKNIVGPDGTFVPGHVFRCADGNGTWQIGAFDPAGGQDTPGDTNDCQGSGEFATLDSFTVTIGSLVSGDLNSLLNSDDDRMVLQSTFGFSVLEPDLNEVQINATSGVASPTFLDLLIEDNSSDPSTTTKIRLRNQTNNSLQQVATYATSLNNDMVHTFDDLDATLYVGGSGQIEARIKFVAAAVFAATGFRGRIDQFTIFVD